MKLFELISKVDKFYKLANADVKILPSQYEKSLLWLVNHDQERAGYSEDPDKNWEDEMRLVAEGKKLFSFHTLIGEYGQEGLKYALSLGERFGLKHKLNDILYKNMKGNSILFYNPNNPESMNLLETATWVRHMTDNSYTNMMSQAVKHILLGLIAGFKVDQIKSHLIELYPDVEATNEKILSYFPPSLSSIFKLN